MSTKSPTTSIKLTVSLSEVKTIDAAVKKGYARSRADLCRMASIQYLESLEIETEDIPKTKQVVFTGGEHLGS